MQLRLSILVCVVSHSLMARLFKKLLSFQIITLIIGLQLICAIWSGNGFADLFTLAKLINQEGV